MLAADDDCHDGQRRIFVSYVVLNNQARTSLFSFVPYCRIQDDVKDGPPDAFARHLQIFSVNKREVGSDPPV